MRIARAWATDGARLTPSAPSAPSAAETPPENLTKSRRDNAPAFRFISPAPPLLLDENTARSATVLPVLCKCWPVSGLVRGAYTASGRVGDDRLSPRRRSQMFKKTEEQE